MNLPKVIALSLFAVLFTRVTFADKQKSAERVELATTLVNHMAAGEFEKAVERFDKVMTRALPAEKLKTIWSQLISQNGSLKKITGTRTAEVQQYHVVFVTGEFERGRLDTRVVFTAENEITGLFFVPTGEYRSPKYADASKFKEEEITVGKGLWSLPGTLSLPNGEGLSPGVVLVHGSGPNDRDETIGPNKPFRDLAHGLASLGIAVLRYEKRTRHHRLKMSLLTGKLTVKEETVDDAAAAVDTMRSHQKIDAERVFVLGHSLGGNLIPRIAAANEHAAGFISLAGSTRPLEDLILEQTRYILALDGELSDEEQEAISKLKTQVARVKSPNLSPDTPTGELPLGVPANYWLDLKGYDPSEKARAIKRPLLIMQGERDYQVTMADFAKWKAATGSRDDVRLISYPKLNHLFMEGTGRSSPAEYAQPNNVAEDVVNDIADWVKGPKVR